MTIEPSGNLHSIGATIPNLSGRWAAWGPDGGTHGSQWVAAALFMEQDFAGARAHFELLLEGTRRALGDAHPDTVEVRGALIATMCRQGDLAAARAQEELAVAAQGLLVDGDL